MKELNNRNFTYELFIDFEEELEKLLKPEEDPKASSQQPRGVRYNPDGTIYIEDINQRTLTHICQDEDLGSVRNLEIAVATRNIGDNLSLFSLVFSSLSTLVLDYSKITTLRVLGDEIPSLKKLSVNSCNLTDLDGISYVPNLRIILASDNSITDVLPLTDLLKINTVDLEKNSIRNYNSISFLCLCTKLEHLTLQGNPISFDDDYRSRVFSLIRQLSTLDANPHNRKRYCRIYNLDDNDNGDNEEGESYAISTNDLSDNLIQKLIHQTSSEDLLGKAQENDKKEELIPASKDEEKEETQLQGLGTQSDEISSPEEKEYSSNEYNNNEQLSLKLLCLRKSMEPIKLRSPHEEDRPDSSLSSVASQSTDSGISEASGQRDTHKRLPQLQSNQGKPTHFFRGCESTKPMEEITYNTCFVSKIIRQDSQLNGKLIKDGDIEIEDYDDN